MLAILIFTMILSTDIAAETSPFTNTQAQYNDPSTPAPGAISSPETAKTAKHAAEKSIVANEALDNYKGVDKVENVVAFEEPPPTSRSLVPVAKATSEEPPSTNRLPVSVAERGLKSSSGSKGTKPQIALLPETGGCSPMIIGLGLLLLTGGLVVRKHLE